MASAGKEEEETPLRVAEENDAEKPQCSYQPEKAESRVPKLNLDAKNIPAEERPQALRTCNLCHDTKFQEPTAAQHDKRLLKPCFCDFYCHHGCLRDVLRERKKCLLCGVPYRVLQYGSIGDFFRRYWYQYACCIAVTGALLLIGLFGIISAFRFEEFGVNSYFLIIFGAVLLILAFACIGGCCRNTLYYRLRRFRERYGEVTIFDYKPAGNNKGSSKPSKTEFETLNRVETGPSGNHPMDMTAGQYLLGHNRTVVWQQSSTPLDGNNQPVRFTFDTPMTDLECKVPEKKKAESSVPPQLTFTAEQQQQSSSGTTPL